MNYITYTRRAALIAVALATLPLLAGCPPPQAKNDGGAPATGSTTTTGGGTTGSSTKDALTIKGSETLLPLAKEWTAEFAKANPGANITVSGGGSGQGIAALIAGTTDIADASRKIEGKETGMAKAKGITVKEVAVAKDGITIIVNPKNPIKSLTLQQLADIYTGKTKNWKEVGGADQKIVASGRDSSSGTYSYFKEEVLKKVDYRADMISNGANPPIATNVAQNAGGIGYLGVSFAGEYTRKGVVKEVPISFAAGQPAILPTAENVHSGKYPISRSLYNYVSGEPTGTAKAYLDFVTGEAGQKIVEKQGYITLK